MNELHLETSPYLLQHAANPVHWKAWNDPALAAAASQNKLLIVSVGYSACHWCHVMEHETFEDAGAADVMNRDFVSIKVDREERPDVDAVYMKAVQIMTGRGGWPMNVVALPDGRPVWGGTYFRRSEWMDTLEQLQNLWRNDPAKMIEYAEKLTAAVHSLRLPVNPAPETPSSLASLVEKWKKSFDPDYGGMARAPKFMMPCNYRFLMHYGHKTKDPDLLAFVDLTLTRMAWGGLFDTVGGGFSRYAVDMRWHVPHFEKMLYDNGQLVSLYADAYKRTQNLLYREVIEKTLAFVSRELANNEGGFYSALDADSPNAGGHSEEGAFYTWTKPELEALLGDDFPLFAGTFNVNDSGHWENGRFVLIQSRPLEETASENSLSVTELASRKQTWERTLFEAREKRTRPGLDDKSLTSWNAIMIRGYAEAFLALGHPGYRETALAAGHFLLDKLWSPEGFLWRTYKNGKAAIPGFLEDYACAIDAFISLYEISFDATWLGRARQLADYTVDRFFDAASGFFSFRSRDGELLVSEHYEVEDNVIPASNSVMAENLFRLGVYFLNPKYEAIASGMAGNVIPGIDYPSAFANWMQVSLRFSDGGQQLAACGAEALETARLIQSGYHPELVIAASEGPSELPFLAERIPDEGTHFYLCESKACHLPQTTAEGILKTLTQD